MIKRFAIGDRVRRLYSSHGGVNVGDEATVVEFTRGGTRVRLDAGDPGFSHDPNNLELVEKAKSPLDVQVGGDHYKKFPKGYQPFEISHVLGLNPLEHTILKYLLRHRTKGKRQDLDKIKHCVDILAEQEYPNAH